MSDLFNSRQAQSEHSKEGADTQNKQSAAEADFKNYFSKAGFEKAEIEKEFATAPALVGSLYYLHGDHLGTATYVTNEYAEPTQFFLNLPFGETMVEQQEPTAYVNPYKFNSKELDSETGLYYYGARYYNPRLSIWYGVDPLAEKYPNWNPYNYTMQNPVKFIDPDGRSVLDWYKNNSTHNIEWHEGSGERDGYTNLTALNNTRVFSLENGQRVQEFNLNSDGSFTTDGRLFNNGESVTTFVGTTITSKAGFDSTRWISHLGNEGGDYYANLGGNAVNQNSPFFRPEIDKIADTQGFFGGMLTPLAIGSFNPIMDRLEAALGLQVQVFGLIDPVKALATDNQTYEFSGNQTVGLNIYRGSGDRITGVGVKTQDIHLSGLSRSQRDSVSNRFNADGAKFNNQKDSVLRRIMKSR